MNRTIKKQFWVSKDEAYELKERAQRACLSEAAFLRLLVRGYEPKENPCKEFHQDMNQLSAIGNNLNQIAKRLNALGKIDLKDLKEELDALKCFRLALIKKYLEPSKTLWL